VLGEKGIEGRIYVDGILAGQHNSILTAPGGLFNFGATDMSGNYSTSGWMDELHISDTARYAGSIVTIPTHPWLPDSRTVALYHFDECTGQVVEGDSLGVYDLQFGAISNEDNNDPQWSCMQDDSLALSDITVYPNPTSNLVKISVDGSFNELKASIYALNGKRMIEKEFFGDEEIELDISELRSGLYFVSVKVKTGTAQFKLLVN